MEIMTLDTFYSPQTIKSYFITNCSQVNVDSETLSLKGSIFFYKSYDKTIFVQRNK